MELKSIARSSAGSAVTRGASSSSALQVNKVVKIQSLELAKVRKMEMERHEEARKAHRESVRAEIEKRKNEREEIKKKEEEKKAQEERKLLKEMRQLSNDLKNLRKEIKKSGKLAMKQSSKVGKVETVVPLVEPLILAPALLPVEPLIEAIEPTVEAILPPIEAATIETPSPIFEGSSARSKIVTADFVMTGTSHPYHSRAEIAKRITRLPLPAPSLIPRLTKKPDLDLLRAKGSDSDSDLKSESGSPTGVLERTVGFGSGVSSCGSSSGSAALESDDDLSTCGSVPVLVEL